LTAYHGPRDYLDAAKSLNTPIDELVRLASSEYPFVRLAIAENPNTPSFALSQVLPEPSKGIGRADITKAVAIRKDASPILLEQIAETVRANRWQSRRVIGPISVVAALCCNKATPIEAIQLLIMPETIKPRLRKIVARKTRRKDVLNLLLADPSPVVVSRAEKTLAMLDLDWSS
jgi:hypothetical protein